MTFHCAIQNCHNGSYRLNKWKQIICTYHGVNFGSQGCICEPPFTLTPFPTRRSSPGLRDKWIVLLNRVNKKKGPGTLLSPSKNQRVCSDHFVDKVPTINNPYPTKHLGYNGFEEKVQEILNQDHFSEHEAILTSSKKCTKKPDFEDNMKFSTARFSEPDVDSASIELTNQQQDESSSSSKLKTEPDSDMMEPHDSVMSTVKTELDSDMMEQHDPELSKVKTEPGSDADKELPVFFGMTGSSSPLAAEAVAGQPTTGAEKHSPMTVNVLAIH